MGVRINFGKEWNNLQRFLDKGVEAPVKQVVKRVAGYAENRMGLNANQIVYSYTPKTNRYKRTGRLLGGRGSSLGGGFPAKRQINPTTIELEANPQLKGARSNYAVFVNEGTDRMPARPFFDRTVDETQEKAPELAKEILDKHISKL
jgi:hypothetical protein